MKKISVVLCAVVLFAALTRLSVLASAPPGPYFNGFEKNTNGWFNVSGATITREPSGYVSPSGYASGIVSASGEYHARLGLDPSPDTCQSGSGPHPIYYGPYTNWGGYSSTFPSGGYKTQLDIYLDVSWATTHPDARFDWSSAINDPNGNFRRDFVFNAGTDPLGLPDFVISAGNNSNRCGAYPSDPGHMPIHITESGWYTFEQSFNGTQGGALSVTMTITQKSTGTVMGTWVRSDPSDVVGVTVGGNRYGWFVQNEIPDLAIDNSLRTGLCNNGDGDGDVEGNDSRKAHMHFHKNTCESGDDDVEEDDDNSGAHFQSTAISSATFIPDDNSETATIIGTGLHNGVPVGFTMVAVDNQGLAPGVFTLILTDGYVITGNVISGGIVLQ
jgi:hypothetical protein